MLFRSGRTLRLKLRRLSGYPLFLRDFNLDLLTDVETLRYQWASDLTQYNAIIEAMGREERLNPGFPKFYDIPEIWQLAAGRSDLPKSEEAEFIRKVKARYRMKNTIELARQKRNPELRVLPIGSGACPAIFQGL